MATYLLLVLLCALCLFIVLYAKIRYKFLAEIVLIALIFRLALVYADYYGFFAIPGGSDAGTFTDQARLWSALSWSDLLANFEPGSSKNYSAFGGVFYKIFGYHELMLPFLNVLSGTLIVFITGVVIYKMWGRVAAQWGSSILALYPFAAFNSAIALREEISILAFAVGLYFLTKWLREESQVSIFFSLGFFGVATSIHPGWVGALVGLGCYSLYQFLRAIPLFFNGARVNFSYLGKLSTSLVIIILAFSFSAGGVSLGKGIEVGSDDQAGGVGELIESRFSRQATGGSAYPSAIATGDPFSQPWLIPARIVYFVFSPFPWDIRSPHHLIGFISTIMYFFLVWRIFKGWSRIKRKQECLALLLMLGALTFVFAIGVTNIGTAIRHKTKFLLLFVVLAASSFDTLKIKLRK
ncbi:hypothetical protein [Halomonas sp. M20]|uniref:hypothetical protein n=1 Tax=Halomonas sp. M20 TaxID=2763264 RepID=UPI001D0B95B5|nr:hypothetical protein [Halomonas sp. M20]